MAETVLFDNGTHRNILLEDYGHGMAVQANQHLIVNNSQGMILDPGGHKVFAKALADTNSLLRGSKLIHILLSHQDPDIVAACNGWLMTTDADAWCSSLWTRFVPHFGLDHLVLDRLKSIPDEGMHLPLGDTKIAIVPAHFLHSCGNFQVYDSISKILYTGDLGASLGMEYTFVKDFDEHMQYMEGFHQRYMGGNAVMRAWARMARQLDIDIIAPQHGAAFKGPDLCDRFIDWCEGLACGPDLLADSFALPPA